MIDAEKWMQMLLEKWAILYLFFNETYFGLLDTGNRIFNTEVWDSMFQVGFFVAGIHLDTDKKFKFLALYSCFNGPYLS